MAAQGPVITYYVLPVEKHRMDAGWENPFRPGGELSKEADQIVRAIQSGRPLDSSLDEADAAVTEPTAAAPGARQRRPGRRAGRCRHCTDRPWQRHRQPPATVPSRSQTTTLLPTRAHRPVIGTAARRRPAQTAVAAQSPGTVEVQHTLVKPEDASQVEQVNLKKKPRGKCCVVQ
ncbi:hypothetical protein FJT64_008210 [Amphibalanus amphitrite]|uniref:Uncharacterized protein n=1 Tax=Amphibalanus amphitrite TaxID=1232801 RepID=A0A6A4VRN5_AMPAM|nr:hypothetical protein FJT64_008210 [Amphibalanus amphitrite]